MSNRTSRGPVAMSAYDADKPGKAPVGKGKTPVVQTKG